METAKRSLVFRQSRALIECKWYHHGALEYENCSLISEIADPSVQLSKTRKIVLRYVEELVIKCTEFKDCSAKR